MQKIKENKSRPSVVSAAVNLLYITVFIGAFRGFLAASFFREEDSFLLIMISVIFSVFLIYMISKGKNWARILFLISFMIGAIFSIISLILIFSDSLILGIWMIIELGLNIVGLVFLFKKESSDWFKYMNK